MLRTLKITADHNVTLCFWQDPDGKRAEVKSLERKRCVLEQKRETFRRPRRTERFEMDHTHVFWEGGDHDGDGRVIGSARQTLPEFFGNERHERMQKAQSVIETCV